MPGILKRFQQLETDESPKAAQSSGLSAQSVETVHPERSTLSPEPSHGPPGALEPIGLFWPYGETEFSWIYRQLQNLDAAIGGGGGGDVVLNNITNVFTEEQIIQIQDLTNNKVNLSLSLDNSNAAISYPLKVGHTYQPGVGPVGLGVGMSLEVESATEGVKNSIGAFEAQALVMTNGAMTSEAGVNVVVAGDPERVMTWGHQHVRNHFQPEATAAHALFELGQAGFVGDADGTYYGARAEAGYTGDFVNFQVGGSSVFRVDEAGSIYVNGAPFTGSVAAPLTLTLDDATSNAPTYPLRLRHTHSAGAGANGIGAGLQFEMENSGGAVSTFGSLYVDASNAGVGNLTSSYHFVVKDNNADHEMLTVANNYVRAPRSPAQATDRALIWAGDAAFTGNASGTLMGASIDPGYGGDFLNLQMGARPRVQTSGIGQTTLTVHDNANTGPTAALAIVHRIDGVSTPAAGMGVGLEFQGDDNGKTVRVFGKIEADGRDLTANAVDADMVFHISVAGVQTEAARFRSSDGALRVVERVLAQAGLGTGNRTAATTLATPGTVTGYAEFFDAFTGASIGAVPLYDPANFS